MSDLDYGLKKWIRISVLNFIVVAVLGALLRYKIAFSLPFIDQSNLLHTHSHFAFAAWVSQALMAFMVYRLSFYSTVVNFHRYRLPLYINLFSSIGMLCSFPFQGYGAVSISFSSLQIVGSIIFMVYIWRDCLRAERKSVMMQWFIAASFLNVFSAIGPMALSYMMATNQIGQQWYLGSIYFFLHFQYNGWFGFTILGLISEVLEVSGVTKKKLHNLFLLFLISCFPAYFLSIMWMKTGQVVYIIAVIAAFIQFFSWCWMAYYILKGHKLKPTGPLLGYHIILLSLLAFSIKFVLQLGSTIPALSKLAFGYRPVVIGYLHLVLLGFVSLFIIGYAVRLETVNINKWAKSGIAILIIGVIANELTLFVEGVAAIAGSLIPGVKLILLIVSLVILTGLIMIRTSMGKLQKVPKTA